MDQLLHQVAQNVEKQLDKELDRLETLEVDDLEAIRAQRLAQMKKRAEQKQQWLVNGHGEYSELDGEKEFFTATKQSERVVCHMYRGSTPRCAIVDMHLKVLATKHVETRFVKLDVERAPFITERLSVRVIPTIVLVKEQKVKHHLVGFSELGDRDDFTTDLLEWRLAQSEVIEYSGDLLTPPAEAKRAKQAAAASKKTIRGGQALYDNDDDDIDFSD